jgi:hypothetical protein
MKVIKVTGDRIEFENGLKLYSEHDQDCCESHYLDFSNLTLEDFKDLDFDLSNDSFFTTIDEYGISLNPIKGFPVRIPGYGYNNGYYSTNLILKLSDGRSYDITDCQNIQG